jgi:hypothetical protein
MRSGRPAFLGPAGGGYEPEGFADRRRDGLGYGKDRPLDVGLRKPDDRSYELLGEALRP